MLLLCSPASQKLELGRVVDTTLSLLCPTGVCVNARVYGVLGTLRALLSMIAVRRGNERVGRGSEVGIRSHFCDLDGGMAVKPR